MRENEMIRNDIAEDSSWENFLKMAEYYEDPEESIDYANDMFSEESLAKQTNFQTPEEVLKFLFGYDSFREGQKEVIENILSGRDAFAVMPTGAGKSVCYQIPALLLPGVTLVISPLISLMQDQVEALKEAGVSVAFINSSLSEDELYQVISNARNGQYKLLYVAPERLLLDGFLELSKSIQISMVTVDEAHCISQWGQDFRPSYMRITEYVNSLPNRPIISAFTATATEMVRQDIVCTLGLKNPYTVVTGFDRENLFFRVERPKKKKEYVVDYIKEHPDESGIIYCATKNNVDEVYELLREKGVSVGRYHAGMQAEERTKMQNDFVYDYTSIVVATNAFGMGIDKSNVRFVIHYNMPQSVENYYQEAGRAGRDGAPAKCILLYSPQDMVLNRKLLGKKIFSGLDPWDIETAKERDQERLRAMGRYCQTTECLRNYILKYFGEHPESPCNDCGNCLQEFETLDMTEEAKKIINCVFETKGRYGKNIVLNTLLGAKTERLEEIGATGYKSYGTLSGGDRYLLKRVIEQMILEGYLVVGNYKVLKMGNITPLKEQDRKVLVKITDEDKKVQHSPSNKKNLKGMNALTFAGFKLFERLKQLRLEIAREEKRPPYIIFSDKTLIDMASKVPFDKQQMLNVSGVGENKYHNYGERFLKVIEECTSIYPELLKANGKEKDHSEERQNENKQSLEKKRSRKQEFFLLEEEAMQFQFKEYMLLTEIRDEMNRLCKRSDVKKLYGTRLTELLISENLIEEINKGRYLVQIPTVKGYAKGIKEKECMSEKGNAYTILEYPKEIQEILVRHYIECI